MGRYTTRLIPFGFLLLLVSKMGVTPTRATTIRLVKGSERGRERKIGGGTERERERAERRSGTQSLTATPSPNNKAARTGKRHATDQLSNLEWTLMVH